MNFICLIYTCVYTHTNTLFSPGHCNRIQILDTRIIPVGLSTPGDLFMNSKYYPPTKESGFFGEMSEAVNVQRVPRTSCETKKANAVSETARVMPKGLKSQLE